MKYLRFVAIAVAVSLALSVLAASGARSAPAVQVYRLQTMGSLTISLPVEAELSRVMYRNAAGAWTVVPGCIKNGLLQMDIDLADIKNGRTILVLGVSKRVNLDDQEPPAVVRFEVDGASYGAVSSVAMGGVEKAPQKLVIEVKDELNWLRIKTLCVSVNGKSFELSHPGLSFERLSPKSGIITVDLKQLMAAVRRQNNVSVRIDDYAIDEDALACTLSFRYEGPHTLADGTVASVDSITSSSGWAEWWVIFDGLKMDASGGTTAGKTWLSEGNAMPHWVRVEFPEPRQVSEVAIWWAYYGGFRSSVAYDIQTWDGEKWVTQVAVKDQKATQLSRHTFEPVTTKAVRLWQPAMAGNPIEAQYTWISELEVK